LTASQLFMLASPASPSLLAAQGLLQLGAVGGQRQQAFALVVLRRHALHQVHFQQLAQRRVERLLAHPEVAEQLLDAQPRIAGDEEQDAVMHPRQAAAGEDFVRFGGESLVAEEEGFHGGQLAGRLFQVKHIDVSIRGGVVSVNEFDPICPAFATGDLSWPSPNALPA
jgi:hypothetical protein